jgi:hypothetical protein
MSTKADFVEKEHVSQTPNLTMEDLNKTATVDTVHQDEAMKVLAHYSGEESWTDEEEKKLRRKVDRRLLSLLCITYGLQYYDKAMLAQAVYILPTTAQQTSLTKHYTGTLRVTKRSWA